MTFVTGTMKCKTFGPATRGWLVKIWSPASAQLPSPFQSTQASRNPACDAVTVIVAIVPGTRGAAAGMLLPGNPATPSPGRPLSALTFGVPSTIGVTLDPRNSPSEMIARAPFWASVVG